MKVITLINGTLISETSSIYALYYAKNLGLNLSLIHIKSKDSLDMVARVAEDIQKLARSLGVEAEFVLYDSLDELRELVDKENIDIIFSSTKHKHSFFDKSFAKTLIRMNMKVDLALVKVVKLGMSDIEKIILPIRGDQLSVKKFAFFSAFVKAYEANSEIFSVDKISKKNSIALNAKTVKKRLATITFHLRHYFRLATLMDFKFSMKHHFAYIEGEDVQSHIAKNGYDLAIVGGHHDTSFFQHHPIDVLFYAPMINAIYFIPYKDEL